MNFVDPLDTETLDAAAAASSATAAAPAASTAKVSAALRKPAFVSKLKEVTAVEGQKVSQESLGHLFWHAVNHPDLKGHCQCRS